MKLIQVNDYQELCQQAGHFIAERVRTNPNITLGLATGGTPLGTYASLIDDHQQQGTSYEQVVTFNLDEYIGLTGDNPQSYRYYMDDHFFNHININKDNTFVPLGVTPDPTEECARYERLMEEHGGIDLQLLGIGRNGHIGFNEPGVSFDSVTHVVDLTESTREANARYFSKKEEVPTRAMTMGIASILRSKEILLLISGEEKQDALLRLFSEELTEEFPASILRTHPNVTIIADQAALAKYIKQEAKSYDR